ncbi:CamS family sex pheromone protein [Bacillus sp. S1-R2T1-FB]|uniref:CamS family sex pheromone protein n=1 Tax=Bacillus sp. S1-R2T1-FB TaxID=1973493 RepID=UPI001155129E
MVKFAIFRQAPKSSLVTGNVVYNGYVEKGGETVEDWKQMNVEFYMYLSEQAKTVYKREDLARVSNSKAKLSDYFQGDLTALLGPVSFKAWEFNE